MSVPRLRRDGDIFVLTWEDEAVGIGFDRLQDSRDGLYGEITVESTAPGFIGRVHGPVRLNLLSSESQTRLANVLAKRLNHCDWQAILTNACSTVASKWRQPAPVVDLSTGELEPVNYLLPGIPTAESTLLYGD